MIKHFFSVLVFILIFFFIFFVISTYISNNNKEKIKTNRKNIYSIIDKSLIDLPLLKNDTNNVIEFNSGYNNNKSKIKRNFWNLFKKND
jgi:predicted PurR-regulated permease PerM